MQQNKASSDGSRDQMQEAEEAMLAIRSGKVDALVVRRKEDEEVFILQGGADPYRAFMDNMQDGAVTLDPDGSIIYANPQFREIVQATPADLEGRRLSSLFPVPAWLELERQIEAGSAGQQRVEFESRTACGKRLLLASVAPVPVGMVDCWAVTISDITDRRAADQASEATRTARSIIESANEPVVVCDTECRIVSASSAVGSLGFGEVLGRRIDEVFDLRFSEDGIGTLQEIAVKALAGEGVRGIEAHVPGNERIADLLISAAPVRVVGDRIEGCVITMTDITSRKAMEFQQTLVMEELNHRFKNALALVQSICRLTVKEYPDPDAFLNTFERRIKSLADTHGLLFKNAGHEISLEDLVRLELGSYGDTSNKIRLSGVRALLPAEAALAMGLVIHELATNAAKYGALSVPEGQVECTWSHDGNAGMLQFSWIESGGPAVMPPQRRGFGCRVITRGLTASIGGVADLRFDTNGVRCEIRLPLAASSG